MNRRRFLGTLALAGSAYARAARAWGLSVPNVPRDLEIRDFVLPGEHAPSNRLVVCVPTHLQEGEKVPLLVALHGLGETSDPRTGAYAFVEHYGLLEAYERLRRPPIARTLPKDDYFSDTLLAELNGKLVAAPFRGIALACPYMPNVNIRDGKFLDDYAAWIAEVVLPKARKESPVFTDPMHTSIDGVSLGGYTGLEVFLRKPEHFGAWGAVQGAFGDARIAGYADKMASLYRSRAFDIHLETSTRDPFRGVTTSLSNALSARGIPHDPLVYPGPHDQVWLREAGIVGMIQWHDVRAR